MAAVVLGGVAAQRELCLCPSAGHVVHEYGASTSTEESTAVSCSSFREKNIMW